ncbi:MAG: hypothetical protein EZS28_017913 [Streblomastix strix]|uniref:Tyr recombinase domain-containing protein n=1 Tax=Streblomastix strix TaxID=222440 RepID=A0A5J4VV95_9EUKA|nr:MAG: hypothetical protein EZS28_017913 [Streblomastix strix]
MVQSEQQIHFDLIKLLMLKSRMRIRRTDKEKLIWVLDIILIYIKQLVPLLEQNLFTIQKRRAIAATLVMVFTVARLAELHRAVLRSTSEDEYINQTIIQKSPKQLQEPNIPNKSQEHWRISYVEKYIQADDLSNAIRSVMQAETFSKTYSVTTFRAIATTKLLKYNVSSVQVDRIIHHSDTVSTVRQYYDKNSNVQAREVLGQTNEEQESEEDQVDENTTPTEVLDDQKAQQDAANAEDIARYLDIFNNERVSKQSKCSLSLQEVVYNLEEYKQSSGRDMNFSFVPQHQDDPTLGNFGHTVSNEVQTTIRADEEHESPTQKEKDADDS